MGIRVMRALNSSDFEEWRELCDSITGNDIFFYPNYAQVYEFNNEGEACCFVYKKDKHDFILYPFLKRRIKQIKIFKEIPEEYYDIASPYGYGGFLRSRNCSIGIAEFYNKFQKFCLDNKIVSEFIRFHPWLNTEEGCSGLLDLRGHNKVVAINVSGRLDDIWNDLDCKCKNRVRKSERSGVVVRQESSTVDDFFRLYKQTMDRNKASKYYYFGKQFFENMNKKLSGNITFFNAYLNNKIIASVLVLFNKTFTHAHLAGTDSDYLYCSPIMLLFYNISKWANRRGSTFFVLGGGRTSKPDDYLFRMKRRFSKDSYEFCIGSKIHDSKAYNYLCKLKQDFEIKGKNQSNGYFPKYRSV